MAPQIGLYGSHAHIVNISRSRIRPLDVLFYIGLGIVAVTLIWFSTHMILKIYVLLTQSPPTGGFEGRSCSHGWRCLRRRSRDRSNVNPGQVS